MPTPIRRITAAQFGLLAQPTQLTRKIAAVHVHHTWRPRRQDFRGLATVEAMRKFHMEQNVYGGTVCILIDVPEETALPYESLQDSKAYRRFRIPAEILPSAARTCR